MPRSKTLVWTPSADVWWDGTVPTEFRATVAEKVGRAITDDEWGELCRAVYAYSLLLNHEHQAEPLSRQQEALKDAARKAHALLESLENLNRPEMGTAFHGLVGEDWERLSLRESEYDRMEGRARQSLTQTMSHNGLDPDVSDELTNALFSDWYASGFLNHPALTADFLVHLREVQEALSVTSRTENASVRPGTAFDELVGRLFEWAHECRLKLSSTKQSEFNNHGRMTYLVKAILEAVPELLDDQGKKLPRQIREPTVADATLAARILDARKRYEAGRPRAE